MIKTKQEGNTTIRISTMGTEQGDKWTVYPYLDNDPTLTTRSQEEQNRIKELSLSGFRDKEDLTGQQMNNNMAEAIAKLSSNLESESYSDLRLSVHQIDVEPEGKIASILKEQYNIKPIESEGGVSRERKG